MTVGLDRADPDPTVGLTLPSGDQAGTAPEDRAFRPDVEGLRAVAVVLVVLFHSGVSSVSGGYVGVDVFFVISGFVITGVLLRERVTSNRTSIIDFYGRRCRRIIPAATVVIIATVVLAYAFLGIAGGIQSATDGRWVAVFLGNFHFIATGTNYLTSQAPPSPLQNFWSLAVEEQFYIVYPTLFLLLARAHVLSLRARLAVGLTAVIVLSFVYSVTDTHSNPIGAYFSPFTRAWELALGALVAVGTPWLLRVPARIAAAATWLGLIAVLASAHFFNAHTVYPGALVLLPVVGAGLIIAGGTQAHLIGAEALLRLPPFRFLGKVSYSLYLWHWPILIIAAEYAGKTTLSVKDNLAWDLVALVASIVTYVILENPIRRSPLLRRVRWASIGLGIGLIAATFVAINVQTNLALGPDARSGVTGSNPDGTGQLVPLNSVLKAVASSSRIQTLPTDLEPPLSRLVASAATYIGFPPGGCIPPNASAKVRTCTGGDTHGSRTMILFGDSHAGMWFQALNGIARRAHWKLIVMFKPGCPANDLSTPPPGESTGPWSACDKWHTSAVTVIRAMKPRLLLISQTGRYRRANGTTYRLQEWQAATERLLAAVKMPGTKTVIIGNPVEPTVAGPDCLARHTDSVQACTGPPSPSFTRFNKAERNAALSSGARFLDVVPWLCTQTCSSVIQRYQVYLRNDHITAAYTVFLEGALANALDLPSS